MQRLGPQQRPDRKSHEPTAREAQVIALLAEGLHNWEIALALGITEETVKSHVKHALFRMRCSTRSELVHVAWKLRVLPYDPEWVEGRLSLLWSQRSENGPSA